MFSKKRENPKYIAYSQNDTPSISKSLKLAEYKGNEESLKITRNAIINAPEGSGNQDIIPK